MASIYNFFSSNIVNSITNIFMTRKERHIILDPFSCLVKLALLKYKPLGTKISIYENKLHYNEPSHLQGTIRFFYGDGREDLHNLKKPIQKAAKWFWIDSNRDMEYLFTNAIDGLKHLKRSYTTWSTIQCVLDIYIIILAQHNVQYMINYINDKDKDKHTTISRQPRASHTHSGDTGADADDADDADDDDDETDLTATISVPLSDFHQYLRNLWTHAEKSIIVNLFRELDTKTEEYERVSIHENIIRYCAMKENRLNKYVEDNSKFLT